VRTRYIKAGIILLVAAGVFAWYRNRPLPGAPVETPLRLPVAGVRLTLTEQTDPPAPGSDDRLRVHLAQSEISLIHRDGDTLLAPTAVTEGDEIVFMFGGREHFVRVVKLYPNKSATLLFRRGRTEKMRIDELLRIMDQSDVTFIRNGTEYQGKKAVSHLRRKWRAAGNRIQTAEQFVEHLGSRSSITGEVYRVRTKDGETYDAGPWMREQLAR